MNLEDLLDENGLQQDEWSLTAPTFGKERQLTVVGWSGMYKDGHKLYILKCKKCGQDSELFGDGYFKSVKNSLVKGSIPCGCSKRPSWSKEQYAVLCYRKVIQLGYTFLGFVGEWKGNNTKIRMLCEKHGEGSSNTIDNLISKGTGCVWCGTQATAEAKIKPNEIMIASFFASGAFHPDTRFWRSERKDNRSRKKYWCMSCPECGEIGEALSGGLQKGQRPCACSHMRQRECYINWLIDDHNITTAIKFGIARDSKERIKSQNRQSVYTLKQHSVYVFPDTISCKKAERECRQELECGVILKRDMPDGYTETTWVYNLDKIIEIYERNGGIGVET